MPARLALAGFLLLALGLPATPVLAATATANFTVTANVLAKCTIAATALAFGDYDPTAAVPTDATSTITVKCNRNRDYNVLLNAGTFSGATVTTRKMTGPEAATGLSYALYREATHTDNWGLTIGTDTVASTGNGADQTHTVFGRIPINQFVQDGAYTDTIIATIDFYS